MGIDPLLDETPATTDENVGALTPGAREGEPKEMEIGDVRFKGEGEERVKGHNKSAGLGSSKSFSHSGMNNWFG